MHNKVKSDKKKSEYQLNNYLDVKALNQFLRENKNIYYERKLQHQNSPNENPQKNKLWRPWPKNKITLE